MRVCAPKQPRVLVVDDDVLTLELTAGAVRSLGYEAVTAANPREALAVDVETIDAVLCDLVMPVMSGDELRAVFRDWRGAGVPFLFMTADADDAPLTHHVARFGGAVMLKPLDVSALDAMLRQLLARQRR